MNKVDKDFVQMAYNQMRGQAERDVRGAMLLEKIAELENVEVSDEEINEEIEQMANYYRTTPEEIRDSLAQQQGGEANIANSLRTRKAVEALVENAKITDGEWIDETAAAEMPEMKSEEEQKPNEGTETEEETNRESRDER